MLLILLYYQLPPLIIYTHFIQVKMGNRFTNNQNQQNISGRYNMAKEELFSISANQHIEVREVHEVFFQKLRKQFDIVDSRTIPALTWYQSSHLNIYLYGNVQDGKPVGPSFFYIKDIEKKQTPIIVACDLNKNQRAYKALIYYEDNFIYCGQFGIQNSGFIGASGQGKLISKDFVYQGEFKSGLAHGYGHFLTKNAEYVGTFEQGYPFGQGIGKNSQQLFIGKVLKNKKRFGLLINRQNNKRVIDERDESNKSINVIPKLMKVKSVKT